MKVVVILSGGLDSTILLTDMLKQEHQVLALTVDYGQRHRREIDSARNICNRLIVPHMVADLSAIRPLLAGSSQTSDDIPVPHGHYAAENMKLTVVPNRNMILLAVAGAYAISNKADAVAYAAHAGDHAVYPDCREEFVRPLTQAMENADWHKVTIIRPYIFWSKTQICEHGFKVGAPLELTYSCYEGGPRHCGKCGTCTERKEAFRDAKVPDPTDYAA